MVNLESIIDSLKEKLDEIETLRESIIGKMEDIAYYPSEGAKGAMEQEMYCDYEWELDVLDEEKEAIYRAISEIKEYGSKD